jgi:hypothetical protein
MKLLQESINDPEAIEKLFCIPFNKLRSHPMDEETTGLFLQLTFSGEHGKEVVIPEKEKPFLYKVIESRVKGAFTFILNDSRLIMFLCVIAKTPGTAIMYLTYMQYWAKQKNVNQITFDIFARDIFPMGFPSNEDLHLLWNAIKVKRENGGSDNLLDYQSAMKSIQFLTTIDEEKTF